MIIAGRYSIKDGGNILRDNYGPLLSEIEEIIGLVNAEAYKTKVSEEKTTKGKILYSPTDLNLAFKAEFSKRGWINQSVHCDYPTEFYVDGYEPSPVVKGASREMDFLKDKVGIEIQFGKYAFMVYNVSAKMTIFCNLGLINVGVEVVPMKKMQLQMSTGVSYFEQFGIWDLQHRGEADIDIPVLILGIDV